MKRYDNVYWAKSKITAVPGFLTDLGDGFTFTRYRKRHQETHRVMTKGQYQSNLITDKLVGFLFPEKVMFQFTKTQLEDLTFTHYDATDYGKYSTSSTTTVEFTANGKKYQINIVCPEENRPELEKIFK